MPTWISDVFRSILSFIDGIVYWFLDLLVQLFDQIANVELFGSDAVGMLASRIYFLIAIVMIFKVSFSIIQYIINPDSFSDKEKGMGQVVKNVILVLVCLIGVQYIFSFAYKLQDTVVHTHIVEKIILGINSNDVVSEEDQEDIKSNMAFNLLNNFVRPNTKEIGHFGFDNGMYTCDNIPMYNQKKSTLVDGSQTYIFTDYDSGFGECIDKFSGDKNKHDWVGYMPLDTGGSYNRAQEKKDLQMLFGLINDKAENNETYIFEYKFFASTAAGIFVIIMYLNFCIDLAIRTVKFGFLQLIAPIPIISMIDPKSSKGGMMSKYVKMCINTYLGLFIRIAAVSFVVFIVDIIYTNALSSSSNFEVNEFIKVVILFGALMFAKELPKLISDLTGIDLSGNFSLNPLKRIPGIKQLGTVAGAAASGLVGGVAGGIAAGVTHHQLGHNAGLTTAGVFRGIGQGLLSGVGGGIKNHGQHFLQNGFNSAQSQANRVRTNDGMSFQQRVSNSWARRLGIETEDNSYRQEQNMMDMGKKLYEQYGGEYIDDDGNIKTNIDYGNLYRDSDFGEAVSRSQVAKRNMIEAQNELADLQRRAAAGDSTVNSSDINRATARATQTKDAYDTMKSEIERLGKKHISDYNRYKAFKAYKDYREAEYLSSNHSSQRSEPYVFDGYDVAQTPPNPPTGGMPSTGTNNSNGNNNP